MTTLFGSRLSGGPNKNTAPHGEVGDPSLQGIRLAHLHNFNAFSLFVYFLLACWFRDLAQCLPLKPDFDKGDTCEAYCVKPEFKYQLRCATSTTWTFASSAMGRSRFLAYGGPGLKLVNNHCIQAAVATHRTTGRVCVSTLYHILETKWEPGLAHSLPKEDII